MLNRWKKPLEKSAGSAYPSRMEDTPRITEAAPAGWLEILAESEAEAEAGLCVPSEVVHRGLRESIGRMEAKAVGRKTRTPTHG